MKKRNFSLILGIIILLVGSFLPTIKIANENISFIKETGILMLILIGIIFILYNLKKEKLIILPSLIVMYTIIKFILDNQNRLENIKKTYNCYAKFEYGIPVMLIGNIVILLTLLLTTINYNKIIVFIKEKILIIKEKINNKKTKKELNKNIIKEEKTYNGIIKYKKLVIKLNNKKQKTNIIEKIKEILKIKRIKNKNLSITKFKNEYKTEQTKKIVKYNIPVIDITKWTRNDICCINCGATISSKSEYCFLCDCKIKLNEKQEKLS